MVDLRQELIEIMVLFKVIDALQASADPGQILFGEEGYSHDTIRIGHQKIPSISKQNEGEAKKCRPFVFSVPALPGPNPDSARSPILASKEADLGDRQPQAANKTSLLNAQYGADAAVTRHAKIVVIEMRPGPFCVATHGFEDDA